MAMTHDEADALLASVALIGGEPQEMRALEAHLADCADCRALARRHKEVVSLLPLSVELVEPSPQLRTRLMATVFAEAASRRPLRRRPSMLRRLFDRLPSGRPITAAGLVAVTGLAAVLIWTATAKPGVTHLTGEGTTAQPQARADLYVDRNNHTAQLEVRGLTPPAGADAVYEVWLIKGGARPQPAAYLQAQPDGTYSTVMSGDMSGYSTLATTLEPKKGNPAPLGTQVFSVSLGSG